LYNYYEATSNILLLLVMLRVCSHSPEGSATAKRINQSVPGNDM